MEVDVYLLQSRFSAINVGNNSIHMEMYSKFVGWELNSVGEFMSLGVKVARGIINKKSLHFLLIWTN